MLAPTNLAPPGSGLLTTRRFLPMFILQFLGALEDNLYRNAMFIFIAFQSPEAQNHTSGLIISLGAGLFILPFFLFSASAGTIADRYEKTWLVQWLKFADVVLMGIAGMALVTEQPVFMLLALLLLGIQAAFFGPVKYSILPQLVRHDELVAANGYVEGGTFIAILLGTIMGGAIITLPYGTVTVATLLCVLSLAAWIVSFALPRTPKGDAALRPDWNPLTSTRPLVREAMKHSSVAKAILGISWFWFVGALFLSMLPNYVRDVLGGTPALVTFLLALFTIGIALGSFWCNRLLHGKIDTRYVPLALFIMAIAMANLYGVNAPAGGAQDGMALSGFLLSPQGMQITSLFLILAIAGGVYTVPLYAILQTRGDEKHRARTIAANNIVNALFMVGTSVFTFLMLKMGFSITAIFLAAAAMTLLIAVLAWEKLSYGIFRVVLRFIFSVLYKARIDGLHNLPEKEDKGVVYVVNHTSLIDGLLLAAFLPDFPVIAASAHLARTLGMKLYHRFADHPPIDPADPMAVKYLVNAVKEGRSIALFPEGRLTTTGILMKVYETPGIIANFAGAQIVPVRIDGAQHTPFSRLRGKVRIKAFPRITLKVLAPVPLDVTSGQPSRQRRQSIGTRLYDIMADMLFESCDIEQTLYEAFLEARDLQGARTPILEDVDRQPRTYGQLAVISRVLGRQFAQFTEQDEYVGVMLPNGIGIASVILSLLAFGRVPALLNFAGGLANLRAACAMAKVRTVITSRRFVQILEIEPVVEELSRHVKIVYVEDIRKKIGLKDKLRGMLETRGAIRRYKQLEISPDDPAVVLFTSGSESAPKGVALSHKNILANRYQAHTRIDLNVADVLFNALPVFHSFGLSVGFFLPLLAGVKTFLYPSPLHYRIIPELIYETDATIMISTDTFLNGYARNAHPYDFYSMRYVVAGGEKLKEPTRRIWFEKFNIRITEGYGVTETAPVIAINTHMHWKAGTVGRLVPGMEATLRPIEGIRNGGSLVVKGPNVMLGYLKNDNPGVIQPPQDGWYDTGDVAEIDEEGYVKIIGRAKRFAKIGGEMVSLAAVEAYIQAACPDKAVAAVNAPDPRKGEVIILYTDEETMTREKLIDLAREQDMPEIMIPRQVIVLSPMPTLATGKIDYVKLNQMAKTT